MNANTTASPITSTPVAEPHALFPLYARPGYTIFEYEHSPSRPPIVPGAVIYVCSMFRQKSLIVQKVRLGGVIMWQEDRAVFEVRRLSEPPMWFGMSIRYEVLGGWYGGYIRMLHRIRKVLGYLTPNGSRCFIPDHWRPPFHPDLRKWYPIEVSDIEGGEAWMGTGMESQWFE
ncbi:hypothetical protein NUW54_g548 [Trametes sanguinea]|uniref:Uncharacterized protein n=1 Tax=Trametes sanguinea TaxID=158606 RepID=A0ACC1QAL6_9APHY|nr:hypothetical protein NUW54_g548 [Trametes sanguinea]